MSHAASTSILALLLACATLPGCGARWTNPAYPESQAYDMYRQDREKCEEEYQQDSSYTPSASRSTTNDYIGLADQNALPERGGFVDSERQEAFVDQCLKKIGWRPEQ